MSKTIPVKHRGLALLAALAVVGAFAACAVGTSSAAGRELDGSFCTHAVSGSPFPPGLCIELSFDGQTTQGYYNSPGLLALRPGTYWLTVTDTSPFHNFSLTGPNGLDMDITGVAEGSPTAPVVTTVKVNLQPGSYTLLCDADSHAAAGMYIDIEVGGVGQVG